VVTETVFAWPGIGRLAYQAVLARDYPVVMTLLTISAVLTLIGNFVADLLYGVADPRIRYVRHASNLGGPMARNTGIQTASGEYIGLLDDDDEWYPQKLERQLATFAHVSEKVGLIYVGHEVRDSYNVVIGPFGTKPQTVGVFLFCLEHPKVQVVYSFPTSLAHFLPQKLIG
jgi:glycosyltransferase involved in cell wall biosynthesis